jgi:hypothetical protein
MGASHVYDIEMARESEAEVFFVPVRPGADVRHCRR